MFATRIAPITTTALSGRWWRKTADAANWPVAQHEQAEDQQVVADRPGRRQVRLMIRSPHAVAAASAVSRNW